MSHHRATFAGFRALLSDPPRMTNLFIVLAALASLLMSLQYTAIGSPLIEVDEMSTTSYAAALARGISPTILTPSAHGRTGFPGDWMTTAIPVQQMIWTANHPPLYQLLAVPFVWLANLIGVPGVALFAMRFLNALATALLVVISGRLARELLPHRPGVALVSSAATASMTTILFQGGFTYNDGLATATGGLALLMLVRAARRGVTTRRVLWIAAWCAASAATRPTGVLLTAILVVAVLLICLAQRVGRRRTIGLTLLVGAVPAVLAGWFYLRNIVMFGDATASAALLERFGREPNPALGTAEGILKYVRSQWDQLFIQRRLGRSSTDRVYFIRGVGQVVAAGFGLFLVSVVVRNRTRLFTRTRAAREWSIVIVWVTLFVFSVAVVIATVAGLADGVGSHERYLMPIEPLLTTLIGLGVVGFVNWIPVRRLRAAAGLVIGVLGGGFFLVFGLLTHRVTVEWFTGFQLATGYPPLLGLGAADVFGVLSVIVVDLCLLLGLAIVIGTVWPAPGQRRVPETAPSPRPELEKVR